MPPDTAVALTDATHLHLVRTPFEALRNPHWWTVCQLDERPQPAQRNLENR